MRSVRIWNSYHDDKLVDEYDLKVDGIHVPFNTSDLDVEGENINYMSKHWCELCTLYYVWKNNLKSDIVGFEHYRRRFSDLTRIDDIKDDVCQVHLIDKYHYMLTVFKRDHSFADISVILDIIKEMYGRNSSYYKILAQIEGHTMIPFCCFIMKWDKFTELCNFIFPILFEFDKRLGLDMDPEKYWAKARHDFRHTNEECICWQARIMGFIAERLITAWIMVNMSPFAVPGAMSHKYEYVIKK